MDAEQLLKRLRRMVAERGTSMADLIREALEERVNTDRPRPRVWDSACLVMATPRSGQAPTGPYWGTWR